MRWTLISSKYRNSYKENLILSMILGCCLFYKVKVVLRYSGESQGMSITFDHRWQCVIMGVFWGVLMQRMFILPCWLWIEKWDINQNLCPAFRRCKKQVNGFCLESPGNGKPCWYFHFVPLKLTLEVFLWIVQDKKDLWSGMTALVLRSLLHKNEDMTLYP